MTKRPYQLLLICIGAGLAATEPVCAQDDTISNITTRVDLGGADYIVGRSGINNLLQISAGGGFINCGNGGIGNGTDRNRALVTGAGSIWAIETNLAIGADGACNSLTISNGGLVSAASAILGQRSWATNNSVLVSSSDSLWQVDNLTLGYDGSFNTLTIRDGGCVSNSSVSVGGTSLGGQNAAVVLGTGATWTISGALTFGGTGNRSNALTIAAAGVVNSDSAGLNESTRATVTGPGSTWNNSAELTVGNGSSDNFLLVTNGAAIYTADGTIGASDDYAHNNTLALSGASWVSSANLTVGYFGNANTLTAGQTSTVSADTLWIGHGASSNAMSLTGGSQLHNNVTLVGFWNGAYGGAADYNTLLISDPGTLWTCADVLYLGYGYSGTANHNRLVVTNGATVSSSAALYLGYGSGDTDNALLISGSNSAWNSVGGPCAIGSAGSSNGLIIANGGYFTAGNSAIGGGAGANHNSVIVTGPGSLWYDQGYLYVGASGSVNRLLIANGGIVSNALGQIGLEATSSNNTVTVTGTNSLWYNSNPLYIGVNGSGNTLIISNDARVIAPAITVGALAGSTDNHIILAAGGMLIATNANGGVHSSGIRAFGGIGGIGGGNQALITVQNGGTLLLSGGHAVADGLTIESSGTLSGSGVVSAVVNNSGTINLSGPTVFSNSISNSGTILVAPGVPVVFTAPFVNDGLIVADSNLVFAGGITDNGTHLDPTADEDGDGLSNSSEILAGTNPFDAQSCLSLTSLERQNNDILVTWHAGAGVVNIVQSCTNLSSPGYADLSAPISLPGSGDVATNYLDIGGATNSRVRFYRIRLGP